MPRRSKKERDEMSFLINDKGRIQYNEHCKKCIHVCMQSFRAEIVCCSKYESKRAARKAERDY